MLVHYAMYLISLCMDMAGKLVYLPYMMENIGDFIKYYKTAKECLTLCKTYNAYVDQKEISKCEDIGNDFVDTLLHLAKGLQFVLVGEMSGRKIQIEGSRRACAKYYVTSLEELDLAKRGFSRIKYYKNMCSFIDVLIPVLEFHANLYFAFDNKLKYPANESDINGFGSRNDEVIFDLLSSESSFNYLYKYSESAYQLKNKFDSKVTKEIEFCFPLYLAELTKLLEEARRQAESQLASWPVVEQADKLQPAPMKPESPLILPTSTIVAGVFVFTDNNNNNKPNQPPPSSPPTTGGSYGAYQPQFIQPPPQQQPPPQYGQPPQFIQPPPQQQQQMPQFVNPQAPPQYYQPQFVQPPPMQQPQYPGGSYQQAPPQYQPPPQQQQPQYYPQPTQQSLPPPSQYTPYQPQYQYPPPPK